MNNLQNWNNLLQVSLAEIQQEKARRHLKHFTKYTFPQYTIEPFHELIADTLEGVVSGAIDRLMIFAPPQHGKLIADDTPILTVGGWKKHGDLVPGDFVYGRQGKPVKVLAVSAPDFADREVVFTDGSKIKCHYRHEWVVFDRSKHRPTEMILETDELLNNGLWLGKGGKRGGRARYQVDSNTIIAGESCELPINPYVLGVWLGDGSTTKNCITHHKEDSAIVDKMGMLGVERTAFSIHKDTGAYASYFRILYGLLRDNGLFGNKHIPDVYFTSSVDQRLELLAGLIDTDGYVYHKNGRVTFTTSSEGLVNDVVRLIASLGWRASTYWSKPTTSSSGIVGKLPVCQVCFNPTKTIPVALARKKTNKLTPKKVKRAIRFIRKIEPVRGKCIQVEGGVYLVGDRLIPTHNSELASIRLPAYWFGKRPDEPIIISSYGAGLAHSKSRQARDVVESTEFGEVFPDVKTDPASRARDNWSISGYRGELVAAGVGGPITGHGAALGIIDDPFENWEQAQSETYRRKVWEWYRTTFRTRIWENGRIVLIMTRWHDEDLAGKLLKEQGDRWQVLRLPALAETQEERDSNNEYLGLPLGQSDPLKRKAGEPLCPLRFSKEALLEIKEDVGSQAWGSEYQGVARLAEGNKYKRAWFKIVDAVPANFDGIIRYWDKAATEGAGDYTAGVLMAVKDRRYYVLDVVRGQWSTDNRETIMRQTAELDLQQYGRKVKIYHEEEPGSSGKDSASETTKNLAGFPVYQVRATGSKEVRSQPFEAQCEAGNVSLLKGDWNKVYINELSAFPTGTNDDQVDGSSGAFLKLPRKRKAKVRQVDMPR